MVNLYSPAELSALLKKHGIAPLKSLGQNFLIDQNIVEKIAEAAVEPGGNVLEVGPGPGALTLQLAKRAGKVVAIEIDHGMLDVLQESLAGCDHVQVLHADFLKVDLQEISRTYFGGQAFSVAGNLPYYITAKCILKVLESPVQAQRFTAMVQQEVAERLSAQPGDKNYGAITASAAYYGGAEILFPVGRRCFMPAPEVDSAIVQFTPRTAVEAERQAYAKTVRGLFAMRRKTISNNLKASFGIKGEQAQRILQSAGVEGTRRAETLSPAEFARLANAAFPKESSMPGYEREKEQ